LVDTDEPKIEPNLRTPDTRTRVIRTPLRWLAPLLLLLVIGMFRATSLVTADPLLAVANNWDMIRVQACIDAYPIRDASIPPIAQSHLAPLPRYRFIHGVDAICFVTSEDLFAFAAWPWMWLESQVSADGGFGIRWVGWVKLLTLAALAAAVSVALLRRGQTRLAVAHALVFALVLSDPAVTLYFSTFYAESAAMFSAWLLLAALLVTLARPEAPGTVWLLLIAAGAFLLALSKAQHVLTPALILAVLVAGRLIGLRIARPLLAALAVGALLGGVIQAVQMRAQHTVTMRQANTINALFNGVLPNADDPERLLRELGLPAECARYSGEGWYTPGMAEGMRCGQAFELKRSRFLAVLLRDPALVARTWLDGVPRLRPWVSDYLGLVAGQHVGALPASQPSLSRVLDRLDPAAWMALVLSLPVAGVAVAWRLAARQDHAGAAATLALGTLPAMLLLIVVLGDGRGDVAKQAHLATTMLLAGWLCIAMGAAWLVGTARSDRGGPDG